MKRLPGILALFFVSIAIVRVSDFLGAGLRMGIWGDVYAVGMAYAVYVSASYAAKVESRVSGLVGVVVFGGADLMFNIFGLIFRLSPEQLVPPESTFLGRDAVAITQGIQFAAVVFGASPTIFSAVLGWMHSQGEKVKDWNKPGVWARLMTAFGRIVTGWSVGLAIRLEKVATPAGGFVPHDDGQVDSPRRWKSLTAEDVAFISANGRGQIMARFGISDGSAGNWRADILAGKRPWQNAKKLTEVTGK